MSQFLISESKKNIPVKKALLLAGGAAIGGAEKRFSRSFLHLNRKDKNIFLIINQALYDSLIKHGIQLDRNDNVILIKGSHYARTSLMSRILSALTIYPEILKIIRNNNIKVLHSMGYFFLINFFLFMRLKGIYKGISIFHSGIDLYIDNILLNFLFISVVKRADFADLLSEDVRDRFAKKYGNYFKGRYLISPCSFTDYVSVDANNIAKNNSIVFLSRFMKIKNPFLFVSAIPIVLTNVPDHYKDIKFYLVGSGPLEKSLKEYVDKLEIREHVIFTYVYKPSEILCTSKIFVSLQDVNNYPSQSLLEAMACQNAIVATDVGETWKLVDEATGIRVEQTPEAVAHAIIELLEDPRRLEELGRNARKKVLNDHNPERFTEYLLNNVYDMKGT